MKVTQNMPSTYYTGARYGEHISPSALSSLLHIGLSANDVLDCPAHLKSSGIRSFWSGEESQTDYLFHPFGFGLNLSRPEFDQRLAEYAMSKGVTILTNGKFLQSLPTHGAWFLLFRNQHGNGKLRSRFIVDASGRGAPRSISPTPWDGRQGLEIRSRKAVSWPHRVALLAMQGLQ